MDSVFPEGFVWNQAELEPASPLNGVLVSLMAFTSDRTPVVAGTGFAISVTDERTGVFCTAAHVIEHLRAVQVGPIRHHPSTPPEFRPEPGPLLLERTRLRAAHFDGKQVNIPVIDWLVWDGRADVAFLALKAQDADSPRLFSGELRFTSACIEIGTQVAILGYDDTAVLDAERDGSGFERFSIARRLVLRAGTVVQLHPEGHALCRGPCFETTIPVSPGMSGSPVVLLAGAGQPMTVVGVVSSSPSVSGQILDRSVSGQSIVAQLAPEVKATGGPSNSVEFRLENPQYVIPPEAWKSVESDGAA